MEDVGGRRTISSVLRGAISSLVVHSDGFWQDSDGTQPKGTIRKNLKVRSTGMRYYYRSHSGPFRLVLVYEVPTGRKGAYQNKSKRGNMKMFSNWWFSCYLLCCWAVGERNNQPSMGSAKVMDGRDKSDITPAGDGRR